METFHEDVFLTFLFCFLVSTGILQIMVAWRGWHGLSIYGGRVRKNINYAMGTALVILGYAWYFSNPLHRNTRNIEGVMSMVCLILGVMAAGAVTAILASLSDGIRRWRGRRGGAFNGGAVKRVPLSAGEAVLSSQWGDPGENLVLLAEPGRGSKAMISRIHSSLPSGRGFLAVRPSRGWLTGAEGQTGSGAKGELPALLEELEAREGLKLSGEVFMGLGWESSELVRARDELGKAYGPKAFLFIAPVIPIYSQKLVGDALLSNTPLDIGDVILCAKPWRGGNFKTLFRLWLPTLIACALAATAITFAFDLRWKLMTGPAVGLILSVWLTYFLASWRGLDLESGAAEAGLVSKISGLAAGHGGPPSTAVLTSEDCVSFEGLPEDVRSRYAKVQLRFWDNVLRGKFFLEEGTLRRLLNLIWEEQGRPLDHQTGSGELT